MKPLHQEKASVEPGGYGQVRACHRSRSDFNFKAIDSSGPVTGQDGVSPALKPSSQAFESMRIIARAPSESYKLYSTLSTPAGKGSCRSRTETLTPSDAACQPLRYNRDERNNDVSSQLSGCA